jgi:hypothetical protein
MRNGSAVSVAALCLAAAAMVRRSMAFTLPQLHHHSSRTGTTRSRNPSLCRELFSSSTVDPQELLGVASSSAKPNDEEQNKGRDDKTIPTTIFWKDDGFVFGLPGSGLASWPDPRAKWP